MNWSTSKLEISMGGDVEESPKMESCCLQHYWLPRMILTSDRVPELKEIYNAYGEDIYYTQVSIYSLKKWHLKMVQCRTRVITVTGTRMMPEGWVGDQMGSVLEKVSLTEEFVTSQKKGCVMYSQKKKGKKCIKKHGYIVLKKLSQNKQTENRSPWILQRREWAWNHPMAFSIKTNVQRRISLPSLLSNL